MAKYMIAAIALAVGIATSGFASAAATARNYQGLWWNAPADSEPGWGINFAHQGDTIFGSWFTYDVDGAPLWMVVAATKTGADVYSGNVVRGTGPVFSAVPFDTTKVAGTVVGTATFTFADSNSASFAYKIDGVAQTKQITRQVFAAPVPTCAWGAQTDLTLATNYQDLWWAAPGGSESGWGINLTHQGNIIFGTWFTYGAGGKPLWMVVAASLTAPKVYTGKLYTGTGPAFNALPYDPAKVAPAEVGTATFTFAHGNSATFAYTVNGVTQTKAITREIFVPPGTVCSTESEGVPGAFVASLDAAAPATLPPLSAALITISASTAAASFEIEYDLGSGLVVIAPADIIASGRIRAAVPPGVFSATALVDSGTAKARIKRTRAVGKTLAVDYSNVFAVPIGALPVSTQPPGTIARLLADVSNKLREGPTNSLISQATRDKLATTGMPASAIESLSPAARVLADRLALAQFENVFGVTVPGARASATKIRAKSFGDEEFINEITHSLAERARSTGQVLIDVGGNLMLGAAIVAVVVESPVLLAAAGTVAGVGAMASYVGLSFGTAEGLILDNASQLAGISESDWKSSLPSLRFFAENTVNNILGDVEDSVVTGQLGVPEEAWNAMKVITQSSPVASVLDAVSDRVEAYVGAAGTPEEQALLIGDSHARDVSRLSDPTGQPANAQLEAAIGVIQGIVAAMPGNEDPVFLDKVNRWLACVSPTLEPVMGFPESTPFDDPALLAALDVFVSAFVSCTANVYSGLSSLPPPPPVQSPAPDGGLDYDQTAVCWKSGCVIEHTTCTQGGACSTESRPAACKDGWCELSAPPVCPAGLNYGGASTGCI